MLGRVFLFLVLLMPFGAFAGTITLDANKAPYSSLTAAQGTSILNDAVARAGSMFAMVGAYASSKGVSVTSLKGQVFQFVWKDGSKEKGVVNNPLSSLGVVPIEGTQSMPASGGVGYTTDQFGNSLGGSNVIGFTPIYSTTTVCVGDYCETASIIVGYQYEYRPGSEYLGNAQV